MLINFCLILLLLKWSECCGSSPYTFKMKGTDKPGQLGKFPWLMVIKDKADAIFKLGYGALIHPQVVITAGVITKRKAITDILIQTNCSISESWAPTDCIERQVVNMISYKKEQKIEDIYEDNYILLILEHPLPIDPIQIVDNINSIDPTNCYFLRWMREIDNNNSKELVTVKYKIPFNDGNVNVTEFNEQQLRTDRDFIVSREFHAKFIAHHISNQNPLNFMGSPLICQDIKNPEDYFLVGIGTFNLKICKASRIVKMITSQSSIDVVKEGSFINIMNFSEKILEEIKLVNNSSVISH